MIDTCFWTPYNENGRPPSVAAGAYGNGSEMTSTGALMLYILRVFCVLQLCVSVCELIHTMMTHRPMLYITNTLQCRNIVILQCRNIVMMIARRPICNHSVIHHGAP